MYGYHLDIYSGTTKLLEYGWSGNGAIITVDGINPAFPIKLQTLDYVQVDGFNSRIGQPQFS
jgi:hypothetical protein